jgi:hypothetical protein
MERFKSIIGPSCMQSLAWFKSSNPFLISNFILSTLDWFKSSDLDLNVCSLQTALLQLNRLNSSDSFSIFINPQIHFSIQSKSHQSAFQDGQRNF